MRIEHLKLARRPESDWDAFMPGMRRRIHRRRRERLLHWGTAAALAVAVLGGLWFLPGPGESQPTFRAQVPTLSEPLFTPSSGSAVAVSSGAVVILPEVQT
jgi:hypothetical protein